MEYLADTVAIVRHLRRRRLGTLATRILSEADAGEHTIYISAITLMEVLYLSQRRRIDVPVRELVGHIAASSNYSIVPVASEIVLEAETVDDVPELHDRMLVATAKWLKVPILTGDQVISNSKHVQAIW